MGKAGGSELREEKGRSESERLRRGSVGRVEEAERERAAMAG